MFGPMLMLNHADKGSIACDVRAIHQSILLKCYPIRIHRPLLYASAESVDYTFTADPVSPPRHVLHAPYTQHTSFLALSAKETAKGTELFTNYGKQWFKDRRIARNNITSLNTSISYSAEALRKEGRCLSDIRVGSSSFPFAGKGAFATKSFARGEVVSVSPVLVLPLHAMEMEANHSVLLNYCISSGPRNGNKSDVALLPLSQAAMMNHGPPGLANVKIDWWVLCPPSFFVFITCYCFCHGFP